jgi:hypothetical protein
VKSLRWACNGKISEAAGGAPFQPERLRTGTFSWLPTANVPVPSRSAFQLASPAVGPPPQSVRRNRYSLR